MLQIHFHDIEIVWVLLFVLIGLLFNSYFSTTSKPFSRLLDKYPKELAVERRIYLQRIAGMFFLGFVPLIVIHLLLPTTLRDYGVLLLETSATLMWGLIFALVVIPLILFNGKSRSNLAVYPQIRSKNWNFRILFLSCLTWIGYLLCYEFLFRGFLLFACQRAFGTVPAVVINVLIYAIAHIPKGKFETIGAIPLGLVLSILTFTTGTIWFAFLAHVIIALTNEWIALYHNKEMYLKFKF